MRAEPCINGTTMLDSWPVNQGIYQDNDGAMILVRLLEMLSSRLKGLITFCTRSLAPEASLQCGVADHGWRPTPAPLQLKL